MPPDMSFDMTGPLPEISVTEPAWRRSVPDIERMIHRLYRIIQRYGGQHESQQYDGDQAITSSPFPPPPSITLSDNRQVKFLNARFRGRNKPTNVLSFEPLSPHEALYNGGEIILAYGVVRQEARESGKPFRAHMMHLIAHGLLHLRGYDHHQAGEACKMEARETRIMRAMGLADPWRHVEKQQKRGQPS